MNEDGIVLQGITQVLSKGDIFHSLIGKQVVDVADKSTGDEEIKLYVDAGFNGKLRFENLVARLRRCDIAIAQAAQGRREDERDRRSAQKELCDLPQRGGEGGA